ncbi:MAG: hypothetical protein AB1798_16480 [Spirochaetota bacterium]
MHMYFDRSKLLIKTLNNRKNKVFIDRDHTSPDSNPGPITPEVAKAVRKAAEEIVKARKNSKPVVLAFGAHTIKNGMAPVLIRLMEKGWLTHLATNGAGIIHDWEFAFQGQSSEDVRENVSRGEFGLWQETGYYINLAINVGAYFGLGYGESVGTLVHNNGLAIPDIRELAETVSVNLAADPALSAAAADLLSIIKRFGLKPGFLEIPHPYKEYGVQAAAYRLNIPFTGHPMFGHDIIYTHPMSCGAAIGRTAERDFLRYADSISQIDGGVYLSVGSAVMSPMIFEKSLSMAQNLALQHGKPITNYSIYVVDLSPSTWDWEKGEPPVDNPSYYLRYLKTFSRMGGRMQSITADNRVFLLTLLNELNGSIKQKNP